jgi:mannosyltransferase
LPSDRGRGSVRLVVTFLIFVGFAARVWRLGYQSLWLDEALTVVFARPNLPQMFDILITQDLHPPLYYFGLHFWLKVAGQSEFSARFLSVVAGVPAVPGTFVLGEALFGDRSARKAESWFADRGIQVGLIGATLVAVSPFLVYYSQEARMYSALATFGVLSTFALWKLLETQSRRWLFAYVGWTLAIMYTQYFGAFVIAFQGIYLLGIASRRRRPALLGLLGIAMTGIGYVPWLYGAYRQMQRLINIPDFWKGDFQLSYLLTHVFAAFALGDFAAIAQMPVIAGLVALLLVGGVGFLAWRALRNGGGELYVLTYLVIPLALLYAIVARDPKFTERYLIMIAPPFYLVFALSLVSVARWVSRVKQALVRRATYGLTILVGLGLVAVSLSQLIQIYDGPGYRKDDNRGAIAYIQQHAQPGDVTMLMMNTYQSYVYYSDGSVPWEPLQPGDDLNAAAAGLNQITAGHRRLWVLLWNPEWADPTNWVRTSLNRDYRRLVVTSQFTGLGLELYEINPSYTFSVKETPDFPRTVDFGNTLQLQGYDLKDQVVEAGKTGRITLYWDPLVQPAYDYIISVRLTDGQYYWWRHDDRPAAFNYPTTYWRVGQVVAGQRDFEVPVGTPPGTYSLEIGVYGQGVGSDLNVLAGGKTPIGTSAKVATIEVKPASAIPDLTALAIPNQVNAGANGDVELLGSAVQTPRVLRGGTVDLTLWWQALKIPSTDYDVQVSLANGAWRQVVATEGPASGNYPTSRWTSGEVIVDKHRFVVPIETPPGPTQVLIQLTPHGVDSSVAAAATIPVGTTEVIDRKIVTTLPAEIQVQTDYRLGDFARLVGTSLSSTTARAGDHLQLTLFWQSLANSGEVGYTAFAHLLDAQNVVKAQQDHPPGVGDVPTTGWSVGEYITDHYDLTVAADATPGSYVVEVGMYNPANGQRLSVVDSAGNVAGDRVLVGTVQVK